VHTNVWYVGLISIFYMMKWIDMCFSLVFLFVVVCCHDIDANTNITNRISFLHCLSLFYVILLIFFSYFFYDYFYSIVYSDWGRSNRNVYWKVYKNTLMMDCTFLRRCILNLCLMKKVLIWFVLSIIIDYIYIYIRH